jgi:hypothetical protein
MSDSSIYPNQLSNKLHGVTAQDRTILQSAASDKVQWLAAVTAAGNIGLYTWK